MLLPQAQSQWESDPSPWLRGVPGRNFTTPTFLDLLVAPLLPTAATQTSDYFACCLGRSPC
eukprot:7586299-Pyramimonas_sp.AAC.1